MENHEVRYNCTIIDLHDGSVVAGTTDRHITSDLAIRTLKKALESAGPESGINSALRPRVTIYFQSIRRILRIGSCDTKHE